jgi:hypothetical protein
MGASRERSRRVRVTVGSSIADWYRYWAGFVRVGSALLEVDGVGCGITDGGRESIVTLEETSFVARSVKDSQYRQRTEALRLVRRIRAKRYLLLKLRELSSTEGSLYTLLVGDLATTARLP